MMRFVRGLSAGTLLAAVCFAGTQAEAGPLSNAPPASPPSGQKVIPASATQVKPACLRGPRKDCLPRSPHSGAHALGARLGWAGGYGIGYGFFLNAEGRLFGRFLSNVGIAPPGGGIEFSRPPGAFFNWPHGGYTLYPGEPGSQVDSGSDYSHINYPTNAETAALMVQARLRELGIPPCAPPTKFLNVNPRGADGVALPFPAKWLPKPKDETDKPKDEPKDEPKDDPKDKKVDPTFKEEELKKKPREEVGNKDADGDNS